MDVPGRTEQRILTEQLQIILHTLCMELIDARLLKVILIHAPHFLDFVRIVVCVAVHTCAELKHSQFTVFTQFTVIERTTSHYRVIPNIPSIPCVNSPQQVRNFVQLYALRQVANVQT